MEEYESKPFPKKIFAAVSAGVIALGIAIYVGWGMMYNSWNLLDWENSGIYALTVVLVVGGIIGMFLYSTKEDEE